MAKTKIKNPITLLVGEEEVFTGNAETAETKLLELQKEKKSPIYRRDDENQKTIVYTIERYQNNYHANDAGYVAKEEKVLETEEKKA